jgi:hypothetical protein
MILKALNIADHSLPLLVSEFVGFSQKVQDEMNKATAKNRLLNRR